MSSPEQNYFFRFAMRYPVVQFCNITIPFLVSLRETELWLVCSVWFGQNGKTLFWSVTSVYAKLFYPGMEKLGEPDNFWTNLRASARPEAEPAEESRKRKFWINFDFPKVKVTREFFWLPVTAVLYQSSFRIWMGKLLLITLLSGTQQWPPRWLSHQILTISFDKLNLRKDFRFTEFSS